MHRLLTALLSICLFGVGIWSVGTKQVLEHIYVFPVWAIASVFVLLSLNLIAVSWRLARLLAWFGFRFPISVVSRASVQGHFAALILISLIGQVAGRYWILRQYGISAVSLSMITAIERIVLLLVSGGSCLFAASWLLGSNQTYDYFEHLSLIQIVFVCLVGLFASVYVFRSRVEVALIRQLHAASNFRYLIEVGVLTVFAYMLVLMSFVVIIYGAHPASDLSSLIAAAAIASFAASLPISVNGWGVREIASVFAFGLVGVPSSTAFAASVMVGICSSSVVMLAYPIVANEKLTHRQMDFSDNQSINTIGNFLALEKVSVLVIALSTCLLLFFQVHVQLPAGIININLADPFALFGLVGLVAHCVKNNLIPQWRVAGFNSFLMVYSGCLIFAFLHGIYVIGLTQWALTGRLLGWFVLLGYLSIGPLVVSYLGNYGISRIMETMIIAGGLIVGLQIFIRWFAYSGWIDDANVSLNFEAYAGNRNAFAFQLIGCSIIAFAYFSMRKIKAIGKKLLLIFLYGLILSGIILSASRAGIITMSALLIFIYVSKFCNRNELLLSCFYALIFYVMSVYVLPEFGRLSPLHKQTTFSIYSNFSSEMSNSERLETLRHGFELWQQSPLLGVGLGVFAHLSTQWFQTSTVIHSTPIWILSEFGLIGFVIIFVSFGWLLYRLFIERNKNSASYAAFVFLIGFFLFSLVHEIFYQRFFWFVLGVFLVTPFKIRFGSQQT